MGAGTPGGPGGPRGGFITPGGPGPGIRPPKGGDGPGIRPPKSEPTPPRINPPRTQGATKSPRDDGFRTPELDKKVADFDKLLEGIKKSGGLFGGPRQGYEAKPAPPMGGPKPPVFDDRVYTGGSSPIPGVGGHEYLNNPKYAEHRKEYYLERERERSKQRDDTPRSPFDIGVGGGPGDIPPRFPGGPRDPRTMRGSRRKAVTFREKSPSTKESPRRGMRKAGPRPSPEAVSKFEEMLAYMKSFQK